MRGGFIYSGGSSPFQSAGRTGYYWSSRAYSDTTYAYYFYFTAGVDPSYYFSRYRGHSLRCLIPTT